MKNIKSQYEFEETKFFIFCIFYINLSIFSSLKSIIQNQSFELSLNLKTRFRLKVPKTVDEN